MASHSHQRYGSLIKVVHYKEKTIMAVISAEDILMPLRKLNIGKNGHISLKEPKNLSSSTHLIEADSERTQRHLILRSG